MSEKYEKPSVTVDIVIFTIKDNELKVLLVKRDVEPFKGKWAIPGGFVRIEESLEDAAKRECKEELGIVSKLSFFSKNFYQVPNGIGKILVTFKTIYNGPFDIDPKAVEKVGFFKIEEIKKMINKGENFHPELLFLLKKHFL